jgi:hypothetical protein
VDSCVVHRDHDETKAFLELLDALEIEKEQILFDHKTYVSSLEEELRKAKTRVVDPDPWKFVGDGEILDSLSASSQSGCRTTRVARVWFSLSLETSPRRQATK